MSGELVVADADRKVLAGPFTQSIDLQQYADETRGTLGRTIYVLGVPPEMYRVEHGVVVGLS